MGRGREHRVRRKASVHYRWRVVRWTVRYVPISYVDCRILMFHAPRIAIQIAKLAGFSPIITTASPHNIELLTSLGATHIIDRSLEADAILAKLPELTGGKPLEFVYDAISLPETMPLAYQALAPGGGLVIVLGDVIPATLKDEGDQKQIAYVFGNVHTPENRACGVELYKRLTEWLEKGIIKVRSSLRRRDVLADQA